VRSTQALPLLPALAVLPHRCENVFVSAGGSNWRTVSTCGRSSPRAATSVARRIDGAEAVLAVSENAVSERVRAVGVRCPCIEKRLVDLGRIVGRICTPHKHHSVKAP
jgi:hypothetical protein